MVSEDKPAILVMEDDRNLIELYSEALGLEGFPVDGAATIQEARDFLAEKSYKVFLCDMHIGEERSTALLRELLDKGNQMQVIMLSGTGQYQAEAMAMGVDFFLAKPVNLGELVSLVDRLTRL